MTTAAQPENAADLPRLIEGRTARKGVDSRFWFGLAENADAGKRMIAGLAAGFDAYLADRRIARDTLHRFDMVEAVLTQEEVAAESGFIAQLAQLSDTQKFANFLEFVGKRDLAKKYKQRSRR